MLRTITTFLLSVIGTLGFGQITEGRNSLLSQLIDEVKRQAVNYKQVTINGPIPWDTSEFVFKKYFTNFDTTDRTDFAVLHIPTKRRIILFSNMVTSGDRQVFRGQIINQFSDSFNIYSEIDGDIKSTEKLIVSFSQPLVTLDGKIAIIKTFRRYSSGDYSKFTSVYRWSEGTWTVWDYLDRSELYH